LVKVEVKRQGEERENIRNSSADSPIWFNPIDLLRLKSKMFLVGLSVARHLVKVKHKSQGHGCETTVIVFFRL